LPPLVQALKAPALSAAKTEPKAELASSACGLRP